MKNNLIALLFMFAPMAALAEPQEAPQGGMFTGRDAASAIAGALMRENAGNDIKVSINELRDDDMLVQSGGNIVADTEGLTIDKARNRWEAILLLKANGQNMAPMRLTGRYDEMESVPVLKRVMAQGEVISENDIDYDKEPLSHLRKNTLTDAHDLIGKSPKHSVSQGRAIRADEIASPAIVNKGAKVTMVFKSNNIEIMTYGETMEPGAKGDVIRVRNTTSKTVVEATVISGDRVQVSTPESTAAEAM